MEYEDQRSAVTRRMDSRSNLAKATAIPSDLIIEVRAASTLVTRGRSEYWENATFCSWRPEPQEVDPEASARRCGGTP